MQAVLNESPHPMISAYALACKWNCLPYGGGLFQQPSHVILNFVIIINTLEAVRKLKEMGDRDVNG